LPAIAVGQIGGVVLYAASRPPPLLLFHCPSYYDSAKLQFGNYYLLWCWCFDPKILWFSRNLALSNYFIPLRRPTSD